MQKAAVGAPADYRKISATFLILEVGRNPLPIGLTGKRDDNQRGNRTHSAISERPTAYHRRKATA